eukprot:UC1_evm1s1591
MSEDGSTTAVDTAAPPPSVVVDVEKADAFKANGNSHFMAKRWQSAVEAYTQAIECNPSVPAYYTNRAFAHIKAEAFGAAILDANEAIMLDNRFVKAYYRRATAHAGLLKFKLSLRDYQA